MDNYETYIPEIHSSEFFSVASDYSKPEEIFREAISNSYDYEATIIKINCYVENNDKLIIEIFDNGLGMNKTMITENFWDLGNSSSKNIEGKIGEKGHGTKIFLNSSKVEVWSKQDKKVLYAYCDNPLEKLKNNKQHQVNFKELQSFDKLQNYDHGTIIKITNYDNSSNLYKYETDNLEDYIYWFTKHGSFENEFLIDEQKIHKQIYLKGIDEKEKTLPFGHKFANENCDLNKLLDTYGTDAISYFSKKFIKQGRLNEFPHIKYQIVINVEADQAKKSYNIMLRNRKTKKGYKSADRYGLYICKDYIPIERVNDWIPSFQNGSNAIYMIHGFINCQNIALTANRGAITIDNKGITESLKKVCQDFITEINSELKELQTLRELGEEGKIKESEKIEFNKRVEYAKNRKALTLKINNKNYTYYEPQNEQETYSLFIFLYTLQPALFPFIPIDYNSHKGIDILAKKVNDNLQLPEYFYVEMKKELNSMPFNHIFENISYIICWNISDKLHNGSIIKSGINNKEKYTISFSKNNKIFIDNSYMPKKVEVICLSKIINRFQSEDAS